MILTETNLIFPLSSVKPFEKFDGYRQFCAQKTLEALKEGKIKRENSPVSGEPLSPLGEVLGLPFGICPKGGGIFLTTFSDSAPWKKLLSEVASERQNPKTFHKEISSTRTSNKYQPKLEWIERAIRLNGINKPSVLEVTTPPNRFSTLLKSSPAIGKVDIINEMDLTLGEASPDGQYDVATLLESLDRSNDPVALLQGAVKALKPGGLLFLTGLVSSGFDMLTLGLNNVYLVPPDRANCFSFSGLKTLFEKTGLKTVEASTPGALDVEIVAEHLKNGKGETLSPFEKSIVGADEETRAQFQSFLQQSGLSSFARLVGRKNVK